MTVWGKTPVRSADAPGFIVNRVNRPFTLEALRLLEDGHGSVEGIDAAVRADGFPMGPFELMDLVGIDVNLAAARGIWEAFRYEPRFRPSPIQERLVEAGRLGRKTGEGFYWYGEDGRRIGPAGAFVVDAALVTEDPVDPPIERIVVAIANEAYRALGEGVATASDVDLALRLGAGHPRGPFEWVERSGGAGPIVAALGRIAAQEHDTDRFEPAPLLLEAAARV
jgi:3-hydroxybutyryl-CoA dehydrogenase